MSKKDHQAIAAAIYAVRMTSIPASAGSDGAGWALQAMQDQLVGVLRADNPRFDAGRFREACETGGCKGMPAPPLCAAMGCLCARHAQGKRTWRQACDAREVTQ